MSADDRINRARVFYERAFFGGDASGLAIAGRELDGVEADLALARGRIIHARCLEEQTADSQELVLFERAAQLYQMLGDPRGEAESLFWVGVFHQVVQRDNDAAASAFERSYELATQVDDKLTLSYVLRHLGIAEHAAGRFDAARERLEESTRLRREIGFSPGVAANLVGLAYIAAAQGRSDEATALLNQAASIAEDSCAQGIMHHVEEARATL